jgi:hypothetical protein
MHRIKEVLGEVIKARGMKAQIDARMALVKWEDIAGPIAARFSRAVRLKDGRLTVVVSSSVLLTDMTFRKEEYIERYNELMGEGIVREIEFKLGTIKRAERGKEDVENPLYGDLSEVELSDEEFSKADEIVQEVEDEEIREIIKRAFIGQLKLNKWRKSNFGG